MTNPHLRVNRKIVLLIWLGPEYHLAVPERSNDPEFALTRQELDTADFFIRTR